MILDLAGSYILVKDGKERIAGHLPGCNYLDYMAAGLSDPFFGTNENESHDIGHHDYCYERTFELDPEVFKYEHIELVCSGVDTICKVYINDAFAGSMANVFRTYRFDVKALVKEGENTLRMEFEDPYAYIEKEAAKHTDFPYNEKNYQIRYIRKPACNFGWDWGPKLCPTGVVGKIYLECYESRISDIYIDQEHGIEGVRVNVNAALCGNVQGCDIYVGIEGPGDFSEEIYQEMPNAAPFMIQEPKLWWPNGLGKQPLYTVTVRLLKDGNILDEQIRKIGLRRLELDRSKNADGEQFRFIVNGVPIFAKGADWIPPDQFVTRFSREDMEFYISECAKAHFNMLRVWGGGYYEGEDFYDMCDKYGILVWQDMMFACNLYPFGDKEFLENCREEIRDNVRRLSHRASLALWCGNNEIEALKFFMKDPVLDLNMEFFHKTLPDWIREDDKNTPYWPGSPSSGRIDGKVHDFRKGQLSGDSHLWNIWHGMLPIEKFKKFPTRFCSEFGMESMPSVKTIKRFHPRPEPSLFDEVMQLHQKSGGGNAKILYYMLAKYKEPKDFEDFVYLSQIVQADAIAYATECWKRNMGKQNGALYWQFNDTYPVASWSSIDYYKQLKALQYRARHFNKMLAISNDYHKDRFDLYVVNEYPEEKKLRMTVELKSMSGDVKDLQAFDITVGPTRSQLAAKYLFSSVMTKAERRERYLRVNLYEEGRLMDERTYLPMEDKKMALGKGNVSLSARQEGKEAVLVLESDTFMRYVFVDSPFASSPWSDNFFDLEPGIAKEIRTDLSDIDPAGFRDSVRIKDLASVDSENSSLRNWFQRCKMFFKNKNWATYVVYKLLLR